MQPLLTEQRGRVGWITLNRPEALNALNSQVMRDVVAAGASAPGHVVNLAHGVPPETDPDVLTRVVELIHSLPVGEGSAA